MRYWKIALIFVATCGLVFIAASVAAMEAAKLFGVTEWLGDTDGDTFQFKFPATMALVVFAIACGASAARTCRREAGREDDD